MRIFTIGFVLDARICRQAERDKNREKQCPCVARQENKKCALSEAHFLLDAAQDDLAIEQNQDAGGEGNERGEFVKGACGWDKDLQPGNNEPHGEQEHTHAIFDSE